MSANITRPDVHIMLSCRQQQVIVLRPPAFQDHTPQFMIKYVSDSAKHGDTADSMYTCWRVPHHLTTIHWQQLLKQHAQHLMVQQLVLLQPGSHIMHVLGSGASSSTCSSQAREAEPLAASKQRGLSHQAHASTCLASIWSLSCRWTAGWHPRTLKITSCRMSSSWCHSQVHQQWWWEQGMWLLPQAQCCTLCQGWCSTWCCSINLVAVLRPCRALAVPAL